MALSPDQFHMHMYHGTSKENAQDIKEHGIGARTGLGKPNVYLTHDYELAELYANTKHGDPAIVKVRVNPRNLQVDWNSFEDPVHTSVNRNFDESKLRTDDSSDWKNSLRQTGSAMHWGHIPPENVLEVN